MADTTLKEFFDRLKMCEGDRRFVWAALVRARRTGAHLACVTLRDVLILRQSAVAGPVPITEMLSLLMDLRRTTDQCLPPFPESLSVAGVVPAAGGQTPTPEPSPAGIPSSDKDQVDSRDRIDGGGEA